MEYTFGPFEVEYRGRPAQDGELPEKRIGTVSVTIDPAAVARLLGARALKSRGRVSVEIGGRVKVKAL